MKADLGYTLETIIRFFADLKNCSPSKRDVPAKALYDKIVYRSTRLWLAYGRWFTVKEKREMVKKAIAFLRKEGKLVCIPVKVKYGRPELRPVHHYVYQWVDNALDLFALRT